MRSRLAAERPFLTLAARIPDEIRRASAPFAALVLLLYIAGCSRVDSPPVESAAASPVVTIPQGRLQGSVDEQGVWVFKGIPFAKPPVGKRRWAPPDPPDPWGSRILKATEFAPMCVQLDLRKLDFKRTTGSEDCLMLNVWTTSIDPDARRPVLVFIHGGAHMSGSSSGAEATGIPFYIGSNLARIGPAVVVTIAYRVGALGFIGHRALSRASGYGGSGNYGYMDQIRALEWVRDNVGRFGGDPQKVMLFGGSAGATSTLVLLASPRSRGLFHTAIVHSMAAFTFPLIEIERQGALVEDGLKCSNADAERALECMRSRSAHDVITAVSGNMAMGSEGVVFGPGVDGFVLPGTLMSLIRSGKQHHVPVIVGSAADEFTTLAPTMLPLPVSTDEEYKGAITSYFTAISSVVPAKTIVEAYPTKMYESRRAAMIAMVGDYVYTCPTRMLARALSVSHRAPVRRFLYDHTFSTSSPAWIQYRAGHGFELVFLFGPIPPEWGLSLDAHERELSSTLIRAWVAFARDGSPETPGIDKWPVYNPLLDNYLVLDTPPHAGTGFRKAECDFWDRYESALYP